MRAAALVSAAVACLLLAVSSGAAGHNSGALSTHFSSKKAIWGPVVRNGRSQFPIYHKLGVGIYETQLLWANVARRRPRHPTNPADPAYAWPASLGLAVRDASRYGIRVAIEVETTPSWANGGQPQNWAPKRPSDFADFLTAASRRYRTVHLWLIWGEPSRTANFMPEVPQTPGKPLTSAQAWAPHLYARLLDGAYFALKRVSRHNVVVGGNTVTVGSISALAWIKNLKLPDGQPPHMDLYGHDPYTDRRPSFSHRPLRDGNADFSDLPQLARWLDRYLTPPRLHRPKLGLFLSEFSFPTHPSDVFNFWVDPSTQAKWLSRALWLTESWSRIYTLGWLQLYDDPAGVEGALPFDVGLMTASGHRKPAFYAYAKG